MSKREEAQALYEEGLTQTEIARRLDVSQSYISKLLHPEHFREYLRAYWQRPEVKERRRLYRQRPEVKEQVRAYNQLYYQKPGVKERKQEYERLRWQKPEVRMRKLRKGRRPECGYEAPHMDFKALEDRR